MLWKVASELHILKNITIGLNNLKLVLKAAFHWSPSLIWTLLNAHVMSSFMKYFAPMPWMVSMITLIEGIG